MTSDLQIRILELLLSHSKDFSMARIGKELGRPSAHIFYHIKQMAERGILERKQTGKRVYYEPQPLFFNDVDGTIAMLDKIGKAVGKELSKTEVANCIKAFIDLYYE